MCQVVEEGCGNAPQQSGPSRVLPVYQVLGCWGREENVTGMASWSFMFCTIFGLKDPPPPPENQFSFHPTNTSKENSCTPGNLTQDAERFNDLPEFCSNFSPSLD